MPGKRVILMISVPSLASCEKSHMTALKVAESLASQLLPLENSSPDILWMAEIPTKTPIRRERTAALCKQPGEYPHFR